MATGDGAAEATMAGMARLASAEASEAMRGTRGSQVAAVATVPPAQRDHLEPAERLGQWSMASGHRSREWPAHQARTGTAGAGEEAAAARCAPSVTMVEETKVAAAVVLDAVEPAVAVAWVAVVPLRSSSSSPTAYH